MRAWYKYLVEPGEPAAAAAGAPAADDYRFFANTYAFDDPAGYETRESFYARYYHGYHCGRLESYLPLIEKHLSPQHPILSLASGRPVIESLLHTGGYRVTCSDMEVFPGYGQIQRLFPGLSYLALDLRKEPVPEGYHTVLALGLLYLFDGAAMDAFFANVARALPAGGQLIVDSAISPDNRASYLIHDVLLKCEAYLKQFYHLLGSRRAEVKRIQFGYRKTHGEIIDAAARHGLALVERSSGGELIDIQRSYLVRRTMAALPFTEGVFRRLGQAAPFVNLYVFRRQPAIGKSAPKGTP